MSSSMLAPGDLVADRYRVVAQLGEGGMGVVYSVEHLHMKKLFALKVLHRELLRLPEVVQRFEREAILAGSIEHANVAAATDFGKLPDGSFYLVLELVTGKDLRDVIAEGPIEIVRAHSIMRGIVAGITAAHAKGIVHRDLKPENVMLVERDGNTDFVKVLDFGIAKGEAAEAESESAQPLTRAGTIMGTPQYMAPEQALGQTVDQRSDLYALGVIFYEMITGHAPFTGEPLVVLRHQIATEPAPIAPELVAGVTVPVASIVAKLLAKDPNDRYASGAELAAALEQTEPVFPAAPAAPVSERGDPAMYLATPPPIAAPRPRVVSTKMVAAIAIGAAALGVLLVVGFSGSSPAKVTTANEVVITQSSLPRAEAEAQTAAPTEPPPTETAAPEEAESAAPVEAPAPSESAEEPAPAPAKPPMTRAQAHGTTPPKTKKRGPIGSFFHGFANLGK